MRRAEARRSASMMIRSSIRWSLAGNEVDWMTKTSAPRTFSRISTKISMSAKRRTTALVSAVRSRAAIASARRGFELPATSLIAPFVPAIRASLTAEVAGATVAAFAGKMVTGFAIGKRHEFEGPTAAVITITSPQWQYEAIRCPDGFFRTGADERPGPARNTHYGRCAGRKASAPSVPCADATFGD